MTDKEKTNYLRIGLSLVGITANEIACEKIWRVYEGIQKKKGKFSIHDTVKIESDIDNRVARANRKKKVTTEKD